MNNNSKNRRNILRREKRTLNFTISRTMPGGSMGSRTQTISFGYQNRLSGQGKSKVARTRSNH